MDTKPEIPTQGGSFERQRDGALKPIEQTQPAPEPVNRKSPDHPHPEPEAPADAPIAVHEEQ